VAPQASRPSKTHRSPKTVSRPHKTAARRDMGRSWPLASWPRSRPRHCLGGTLPAIGSLRLSFVCFPIQCPFTFDLILYSLKLLALPTNERCCSVPHLRQLRPCAQRRIKFTTFRTPLLPAYCKVYSCCNLRIEHLGCHTSHPHLRSSLVRLPPHSLLAPTILACKPTCLASAKVEEPGKQP
jgi:hypothetical protein